MKKSEIEKIRPAEFGGGSIVANCKSDRKEKQAGKIGNQNAKKKEPLSEVLALRFTAGQLKIVHDAAKIKGCSVSHFARMAVLDEVVLCHVHRDATEPVLIKWPPPKYQRRKTRPVEG
jgi:hypothetical protein